MTMKNGMWARLALCGLLVGGVVSAAQAQDSQKDLDQALKEVQQAKAAMAKMDVHSQAYADMFAHKIIAFPHSGWMYGKDDNLAITRNLTKIPTVPVVARETTEQKMVAMNRDT